MTDAKSQDETYQMILRVITPAFISIMSFIGAGRAAEGVVPPAIEAWAYLALAMVTLFIAFNQTLDLAERRLNGEEYRSATDWRDLDGD